MKIRQSLHSDHFRALDTDGLRRELLVERLFVPDEISLT